MSNHRPFHTRAHTETGACSHDCLCVFLGVSVLLGVGGACCEAMRSCAEICLRASLMEVSHTNAATQVDTGTHECLIGLLCRPGGVHSSIHFQTSNIPFRMTFISQRPTVFHCTRCAWPSSAVHHCRTIVRETAVFLFSQWHERNTVSGGWKWGIDTQSFRHSSSSAAVRIKTWPSIFASQSCQLTVANVDTWQSEKTRTKQEHYFNLSPLLIPPSAFTQEEQLGESQPPPCVQSITVSAFLLSELAPPSPYHHAWPSQVDAGKHSPPPSIWYHLLCPPDEVKHIPAATIGTVV